MKSHRKSSSKSIWILIMSFFCVSFLLFAFLLMSSPSAVFAFGEQTKIKVARLVFSGSENPRPSAFRRLLWEVKKRTSVLPVLKVKALKVQDPDLFKYPLLYLPGEQKFPTWPEQDILRLRSHLIAGGTLFIDMSDGVAGGGFDRSARRLIQRVFPQNKLLKLPQKHTLFKSFYLIRRFGGRVLLHPYVEGIMRDDRSPIVYSMNDMSGAWERDNFGNWTHPVVPGGHSQREHAFRIGVNLLMYALCVNYKQDGVHIPFIMQRRK